MPQFLAIEWTSSEARAVVATAHGKRAVIDDAFSIALRGDSPLGPQIAEALAARGIAKLDTLVAIGRTSIELRRLQLPAAPDDELPEMVRFQAMREFNELDEQWLLDFMPIDDGPGGPRSVLATALAPGVAAEIQTVCQEAGLKPRRLLLRSCATAALVTRNADAPPGQVLLVVDLLADEADLTVMLDGRVVFLRTTRVADPPQPAALLAEIRLTMAAVQNQVGRRVEAIVLCGQGESQRRLAAQIEEDLAIRSTLLEPFAGLELGPALRDQPPKHAGRFAPLLGMLLTECEQTAHAIDFLHPRRPPPPPSKRRRLIAGGVAAAVLVVAFLLYVRIDHYRLALEVDRLQQQSKELDATVARVDKIRTHVADITKWTEGNVIWLDQLVALSEDCPSAESIVLDQLTLGPGTGGGEMRLKGLARRSEGIAALEESLRGKSRRVVGRDSREDRAVRPYSWRFETSVLVESHRAAKDAKP